MTIADENPFPPEALATNQAGRLTTAQVERLSGSARRYRARELWLGLGLGAFGVLAAAVSDRAAHSGTAILLIGIGCAIVGIILTLRSLNAGDALSRDLSDVRVESVEGAILPQAHHTSYEGGSITTYSIDVAGRRFTVDEQAYRAAPPAGYVRLYFLSRSHKVVNLEQLPDRPLPPDLTPRGMLKDVATSFFRGSARRAETNATMLSFAHAIVDEQANPPPPEARDPRPLAEAIVGTWTNPLFRLSFAPDGSVAIVMPGGRQRTGAWSVDAAGKLHADISGRELVAGAWVAGDRLTIPIRDGALTFQRQT